MSVVGQPGRYRKIAKVVDAIQWVGDNQIEIRAFAERFTGELLVRGLIVDKVAGTVEMRTVHGEVALARVGDWIIPEPEPGRFYPVNGRVFEESFEEATAEDEQAADHLAAARAGSVPWSEETVAADRADRGER